MWWSSVNGRCCYVTAWMIIGMIGSFLFILIQLVLIVDFAHAWNEKWIGKYEDTQSKAWLAGMLTYLLWSHKHVLNCPSNVCLSLWHFLFWETLWFGLWSTLCTIKDILFILPHDVFFCPFCCYCVTKSTFTLNSFSQQLSLQLISVIWFKLSMMIIL